MSIPTEWWETASPYLDEALSLDADQREVWLASLREQNPAIAGVLKTLLEEYRAFSKENFLEQSPVLLTPEAPVSGQHIGAYKLVSALGQGGMGSVWLAERSDGRF